MYREGLGVPKDLIKARNLVARFAAVDASCQKLMFALEAEIAAEAMGVTSVGLERLNIVDETIKEPLGGAHRDIEEMCGNLKDRLNGQLIELKKYPIDELVDRRYERLMNYGRVVN